MTSSIPLPLQLLGMIFLIRYIAAIALMVGIAWVIHLLSRI